MQCALRNTSQANSSSAYSICTKKVLADRRWLDVCRFRKAGEPAFVWCELAPMAHEHALH